MIDNTHRNLCVNYILFGILTFATLWLSSGTLAPYATTHHQPLLDQECGYLLNGDHPHFQATYHFLNGAPAEQWNQSVVIRRILFPVIAYPFMKLTDYLTGGFLASALLHLLAGVLFLNFIGIRYGTVAQRNAVMLLATFPGVAYFGALPYSYSCIVPFTLIGFICLTKLYENPSPVRNTICYGLLLGMLSLGYDLLSFFLPTGLLLLSIRRAWCGAVLFVISSVAIPVASTILLQSFFDVSMMNSNTASYGNIFGAYLSIFTGNRSDWLPLLSQIPFIFIHNLLFSTFLVLPVVTAGVIVHSLTKRRSLFTPVETAFMFTALLIWLFNNAAPPYDGWQLRGVWIARIYLPLFVPMLIFVSRSLAAITTPNRLYLVAAIAMCQSLVVYGPFFGFDAWSDYLYAEFYQHSQHGAFSANLARYGRHPLGSCPERAMMGAHE